MAHIKATVNYPLYDGMFITFKAPCDCTAVDGLKVNDQIFEFKDAQGNSLTGLGNLFSEGAYIKAVLDTEKGIAYLQNANTNTYLEDALEAVYESIDGVFQIGDTLTTARSNLGEDWLLCNGSRFDGEQYPELAEIFPADVTNTNSYTYFAKNPTSYAEDFQKTVYVDGYYYCVNKGTQYKAFKSADLETWETVELGEGATFDYSLSDFKYLNGQFVLLTATQKIYYADSLSGTWKNVSISGKLATSDNRYGRITYCDGYYYLSYHNYLYRADSLDGSWTRMATIDDSFNALTHHSLHTADGMIYGKWRISGYYACGVFVYDIATNKIYTREFDSNGMYANITYDHGSGVILYAGYGENSETSDWGRFDRSAGKFVVHAEPDSSYCEDVAKVGEYYLVPASGGISLYVDGSTSPVATVSLSGSLTSTGTFACEDIRQQNPGSFYCSNNGTSFVMPATQLPNVAIADRLNTYIKAKA